jgi:hypothetical protein
MRGALIVGRIEETVIWRLAVFGQLAGHRRDVARVRT